MYCAASDAIDKKRYEDCAEKFHGTLCYSLPLAGPEVALTRSLPVGGRFASSAYGFGRVRRAWRPQPAAWPGWRWK